MKEISIKSKIVGRAVDSTTASKGGAMPVDLSAYLPKTVWEKVFKLVSDEAGNEHLFSNLPFASKYGITMFANDGSLNLPNIYDGLPIDWKTIYWEDVKDADGNVTGRVLKAAGGGGEGGTVNGITLEQLEAYLGVNQYATQGWVERKGYLTSISKTMVTDALGYTPLDSTRFTKDSIKSTLGISDWALESVKPSYKFSELLEPPTTLSGYGIVDLVSSGNIQLGEKPKYAFPNYLNTTSKLYSGFWHTFIGYNGCGLIIGEASNDRVILQAFSNDEVNKPFNILEVQDNFVVTGDITTNGLLSVNGVSLRKLQNETLYIDGNLAVRGGITMYGIDSVDVPSVMDAIATDNVNLKVVDGVLTFVGQTGGGAADSVLWDNIEGKPSWIGSSKPSYSYSEIIGTPTLLSSFTNDLGLGSAAYKDASGTWGISITGNSSTSTLAKTLESVNRSGSFTSDTESLVAFGDDSSIYFYRRWNGLQLASEYSRAQLLISGNGDVVVRTNEQANGSTTGWSSFIDVLTSNNFNSYALPLTGGIVSGTYGTDAPVVTINRSTHGNVLKLRSDASDYVYVNMSLADTYGVTLYSFGSNSSYVSHLGNKNTNFNITSNTITFGAWNAPKIYIDADSGYLGINTTTPSHALHIGSGNAFIGGKLYVSSNLCVGAAPKLSFPNYINASSLYSGYFHTLIGYNGAGIILGKSSSNDGVIMQCYHPDGLYSYFNIQSNLLVDGGITMYSDIRKKTKLQDVELSLQQIADAPLIEHYYNSDEKRTTHVGSIAQYWAELNDWFCKLDGEGYYTMEIQNAALASAISIARELVKYESKTDKKIRLLKKRIGELEDKIEELEKKGA